MTTVNKILAGVLVVQVLAAAVMWRPTSAESAEAAPLFDVEKEAVTELVITGRATGEGDPPSVKLQREGSHWTIASNEGYPADATKVDKALDDLLGARLRSPVATQESSHKKLQVADDTFTRKVELTTASGTQTALLGAAQGSATHVRKSEGPEVWTVRGFTAFSIAEEARRYWEAEYVKVTPQTVDSFSVVNDHGAFTLTKQDGTWTSAELPEGTELDADAVDKLLNSALTVRMHEPVGKQVLPEHGLDGARKVSWTATVEEQTSAGSYVIGAEPDDGQHYLKSEESPFVVNVRAYIVESVLEAKLAELVDTSIDIEPLFAEP